MVISSPPFAILVHNHQTCAVRVAYTFSSVETVEMSILFARLRK